MSLCLIKHHAVKLYWGSGDIAPRILNSTLGGGEWSASSPGSFTFVERDPGIHCLGGEWTSELVLIRWWREKSHHCPRREL